MTRNPDGPIGFVTLCLYHDSANPEVVTSMLKTTPTKKLRKGARGVAGYGVPQNEWFLSIDIEKSISNAIQSLLNGPLSNVPSVIDLTTSGWEFIISITLDHRLELDDSLISAEQMASLANLHISCKLRVA